MRRIPFMDLSIAEAPLRSEIGAAIDAVLASGTYVSGPQVEQFEVAWAAFCGAPAAVGTGNGTDALELALRALGIGPGDEVLVPDNTFIATAEAVLACGAVPCFVDVDPGTLLMTAETAAAAIGPRTAAMIAVHLYGQPAEMPPLVRLAQERGLVLVEDCAQAHGARWDGQHVGTFGDAGCFSFYPSKNLGAVGDAGAVVMKDPAVAERLRMIADHGRRPGEKYGHRVVGRNSRLDSIQAAVLNTKLPHLDAWTAQRQRSSALYRSLLEGAAGVTTTRQAQGGSSSCHLEVVRIEQREAVRARLAARGIETAVHYPTPCHLAGGYEALPRTSTNAVDAAADRLLSLPLCAGTPDEDVRAVSAALQEAVAEVQAAERARERAAEPLLVGPGARR